MNQAMRHKLVTRFAKRGFGLAVLLSMALVAADISGAQSSALVAPTPAAKPAAAFAKSPASPAAKPPAKRAQEGIKVHGHWTIEVRNPDGAVVSHREFENALNGPLTLASLLVGAIVPAGYQVNLTGSTTGNGGGACSRTLLNGIVLTSCQILGSLGNPASGAVVCTSVETNCFQTLNIAPNLPEVGGNFDGVLLTGTATASQPGQIVAVSTNFLGCGFPASTGSYSAALTSPAVCAAGTGSASLITTELTGTTLTTPVTVTSAGQTISVSVQISFGSQ